MVLLLQVGPSLSASRPPLRIWVGVEMDQDALREIAGRFSEDTGVDIAYEWGRTDLSVLPEAVRSREGPDIVIASHDRLGVWAQSGLLEILEPASDIRASLWKRSWEAVTWNGAIFGYPLRLETLNLIYNRRLISRPPEAFSDLLHSGWVESSGMGASIPSESSPLQIAWEVLSAYYCWPIFAAYGARPFSRNSDGSLEASSPINSRAAISGAEALLTLIRKRLIAVHLDQQEIQQRFLDGKLPMIVDGPWLWPILREKGVVYGLAPIPQYAGRAAAPFVTVITGFVSRASTQTDLAILFLESYIGAEWGQRLLDGGQRRGVSPLDELRMERRHDPDAAAVYTSIENGVLLPNIEASRMFWAAFTPALEAIVTRRLSPQVALDRASRRIQKEINGD